MIYNIDNFIGVFEDVMPSDFNTFAIRIFEEANKAGMVLNRTENGKNSTLIDDKQLFQSQMIYSDKFATLHKPFMDMMFNEAYPKYREKYGILNDIENHSVFANKIQRTDVCEGYHSWHCEVTSSENSKRLLSYIYYLNDVEEGGETEFLYQSKRIKAKAGRLIIFPSQFTHTHRGNPPLKGCKHIMTGFFEF